MAELVDFYTRKNCSDNGYPEGDPEIVAPGTASSLWAFGNAVRFIGIMTSAHRKKASDVKLAEFYYSDVKSSIDNLSLPGLQDCRDELKAAFEKAMEERINIAKQKFESVRRKVESQITTSKDILSQIEAARVTAVCVLYEHGDDLPQACEQVTKMIRQLHHQNSIRNMFAVCVGSGIINRVIARFTRQKKGKPMRHLCTMNFVLVDYFLSQGQIPNIDDWPGVPLSSKHTLHPIVFTLRMTDVKVGRLANGVDDEQDENLPLHLLSSDNSIITYGKRRYGIEAWCPNTLRQVATFVDGFTQSTSLATCKGTVLYVAKSESLAQCTNLTISAYNTLTKKPINVFYMVEGECVHLLCDDSAEHCIMVVTDDGVVHRTGTGSFHNVSRVMLFSMESHLTQENSAATVTRLFYSYGGAIKVYDIITGSHVVDVTTTCWKYPVTVGNILCTFQVSPGGVILAVEARRVDDMNLIFSYKLNEPSSLESPIISCDIADNLLLLLVERMLTVWDLVSGTELTALIFDVPGMLKGHRPCSACFYRKKYIFVATLGGSLFRFAISD